MLGAHAFFLSLALLAFSDSSVPPDGRDERIARAADLLQHDHPDQALAELTPLVAASPNDLEALTLIAQAEFALGDLDSAARSVRRALNRAPDQPDLTALLDRILAEQGRGSVRGIADHLDPVAVPDALAAFVTPETDAVADEAARRYGAEYRRRLTLVDYRPGAPRRVTESFEVRILSRAALEEFASLRFTFDPGHEQICVNRVRVTDATGHEVARLDRDAPYVLDHADGPIVSQDKDLVIPVPGLVVNCVLEVMVTREDPFPGDWFGFQRFPLSHGAPAALAAVVVSGAVGDLAFVTSKGVEQAETDGARAFRVRHPPVDHFEPLEPTSVDFLPFVAGADADETWEDVADDALDDVDGACSSDAAIQETAKRITEDAKSDAEKVRALARFVQRNITYQALEFGPRGQIPKGAAETLAQRYGDCKDEAVLLRTLLASAGIESHLLLIPSSDPLIAELPAADQFDHMIVWCPLLGDQGFLDATDPTLNPGVDPPYGLWGSTGLLLDESDPRLVTLPRPAAAASRAVSDRTVVFEPPSRLTVHETLTLTGHLAADVRGELSGSDPADMHRAAQSLFDWVDSALFLESVDVDALGQPERPLVLKLTYAAPEGALMFDDVLACRVPAVFERYFLVESPVERRETPFELSYPFEIESTIHVQGVPRYRVGALDRFRGPPLATDFCTATSSADVEGEGAVLKFRATRVAGVFPAEHYVAFRAAIAEALGRVHCEFVLRKGG